MKKGKNKTKKDSIKQIKMEEFYAALICIGILAVGLKLLEEK